MAYTLQALIADEVAVRTAVPADAVVVPLVQGKAMIPLSDRMREAHGIPFLPFTDGGAQQVPESLVVIAEAISKASAVAYVEAEFFGGTGIQACVTWDRGGKASRPQLHETAINMALRSLGVVVGNHHDEFDALGLGRHRSTDEWEVNRQAR